MALRRPGQRLALRPPRPRRDGSSRRSPAGRRTRSRSRSSRRCATPQERRRFLTGTPNVPALYAATAGYDLIEEIGVERIRENSLRQTELLIALAEAAGFEVASPREPAAARRHRHGPRARVPGGPQGARGAADPLRLPARRWAPARPALLHLRRRAAARRRADRRDPRDGRLPSATSAGRARLGSPRIGGFGCLRASRSRRPRLSSRSTRSPRPRALSPDEIEPYGRTKAKIDLTVLDRLRDVADGKLICVTAVTPTKAGEGKTTTSVSLTQGLGYIGASAGPLPARAVARPGLRDQGRGRRRRLRAGRADGRPQPPLHRRHPCDRRGEQPARGDPRGASAPRERAPHRPALDRLAALRRHQRPRAPQRRRRARRPGERMSASPASTSPPHPR